MFDNVFYDLNLISKLAYLSAWAIFGAIVAMLLITFGYFFKAIIIIHYYIYLQLGLPYLNFHAFSLVFVFWLIVLFVNINLGKPK